MPQGIEKNEKNGTREGVLLLDLRLMMELKIKTGLKVVAGLAHKWSSWKGAEIGMKASFQNIPHIRKWRALRGCVCIVL